MCIGVPMQVLTLDEHRALCRDEAGLERWIDIRLVHEPAIGDWLLVFLDAAREVIDGDRAAQIGNALRALQAAASGDLDAIDSLFADLVDREPELPPHLRPNPAKENRG